jgi:hypothetical protein
MKAKDLKKLRKEIKKTTRTVLHAGSKFDAKAEEVAKDIWNLVLYLIIVLLALLGIGMYCNVHGMQGINYVFAFAMLIAGMIFTRPEVLIALLKIDIVNMLVPAKYQLDLEDAIFTTFLRISRRLVGFFMVTFGFLGCVSIKGSVGLFLVLLIGTIALILSSGGTKK